MELFIIMIAWILGIIWGLYFKISIALFLPIIIILYFLFKKYVINRNNIKNINIKKYFLIFCISIIISNIQITQLEKSFEEKYKEIREQIQVVGTIISNPMKKEYKTQYILNVESINGNLTFKNTKLLLNVKKENNGFKYGDKIRLICDFEQPSTKRNQGGFDYKEYLKTKKIYGIITSEEEQIKFIKQNNTNIIERFANMVANDIKEKNSKKLNKEQAGLLTGILIGDKENLEKGIKEDFKNSSLSHILAVSGMHVSYIMMGIGFCVSKIKVSKKNSKIITILFLLFFIILTGKTGSVTRACYMSIYMILGSLFYKKINIISSMSISMILLLIENPYCIMDVGLQLSYCGTIGIVFLYPVLKKHNKNYKNEIKNKINIKKIKNKIIDMILITLSANIVIFPIVLFHFNTLSLTFLISNLLASPIIGIIVMLGFLTIVFSYIFNPITIIFIPILQLVLNILLKIANIVGHLPFSQIYFPTPKIYIIVIYYFIILLIILKNKNLLSINVKKIIVILTIIVVVINLFINIIPKPLKIFFVDVGQGDSMLLMMPKGKNILIDGGGSKDKESFDIGESTLLPYLLDRGIIKLDYVLISHFDSDHVGGLLTILKKLKVERVIINKQGEDSENYQEFKKIVKEKNIKVIIVKKGDKILLEENIMLNILWPKEEQMQENILNNNSIVAKISYNDFSILLTGDIEEIAEKQILEEYNNTKQLQVTVLKVAHHGSKSSSIKSLLDNVKPKIALIGVGEKNTFGHPNDGVLKRLERIWM